MSWHRRMLRRARVRARAGRGPLVLGLVLAFA
jgi:hypothetical protein